MSDYNPIAILGGIARYLMDIPPVLRNQATEHAKSLAFQGVKDLANPAPTPEAADTAPAAFAGDVLALDEFLATKFASPLERQAWARVRALVDARQPGAAE